jgi:hypothetical protein
MTPSKLTPLVLLVVTACAAMAACAAPQPSPLPASPQTLAAPPALGPAIPATETPAAPEHHHELNLPPVGPQVSVSLDGKSVEVPLAELPRDGATAPLEEVWRRAFPAADAASLHFDLFGSDGFHPAARPACAQLLSGAQVKAARIDVVTHNVSFDEGLKLPGCYRVKALVRIEATR